jgi:hypothetical protein
VSLGLLRQFDQLAVLMLGVVLLVALGFAINRLAGVDYPPWRAAVPPTVAGVSPRTRRRGLRS